MKIYNETSISDFEAWSGAVETQDKIINENKENDFDNMIEDLYPDGLSEAELNDFLWFEEDWIYEMLGIEDEEQDEEEDEKEI